MRRTREHQRGANIRAKLRARGGKQNHKRNHLPRKERSEDGGARDERDGRSESRAQDETRGKGECVEEEGADGHEEEPHKPGPYRGAEYLRRSGYFGGGDPGTEGEQRRS